MRLVTALALAVILVAGFAATAFAQNFDPGGHFVGDHALKVYGDPTNYGGATKLLYENWGFANSAFTGNETVAAYNAGRTGYSNWVIDNGTTSTKVYQYAASSGTQNFKPATASAYIDNTNPTDWASPSTGAYDSPYQAKIYYAHRGNYLYTMSMENPLVHNTYLDTISAAQRAHIRMDTLIRFGGSGNVFQGYGVRYVFNKIGGGTVTVNYYAKSDNKYYMTTTGTGNGAIDGQEKNLFGGLVLGASGFYDFGGSLNQLWAGTQVNDLKLVTKFSNVGDDGCQTTQNTISASFGQTTFGSVYGLGSGSINDYVTGIQQWYIGVVGSAVPTTNTNIFIDNTWISTNGVPEPGSLLALGTGLVGLLGLAARRRRA